MEDRQQKIETLKRRVDQLANLKKDLLTFCQSELSQDFTQLNERDLLFNTTTHALGLFHGEASHPDYLDINSLDRLVRVRHLKNATVSEWKLRNCFLIK